MTANEIYKQALSILGYSDGNTGLTQRTKSRAVAIFNLVYNDLRRISGLDRNPISSISDEIDLPENALDVLTCGVASYIALSEGDDLMQAVYSAEYQQRRTTLSEVTEIEDTLPVVD